MGPALMLGRYGGAEGVGSGEFRRALLIEDVEFVDSEARREGASCPRSLITKDRERPDTYVQVVEFPSYEEAMANSALPETTAFAEKLSALCSSGPTFRNLDVVRVDEL